MKLAKLKRYYVYVKRAHLNYFAFAVQLINFATITYTLLIVNLLHLSLTVEGFILYTVLIAVSYILACGVIGYLDYKRGVLPVEQNLIYSHNPFMRKLAEALLKLSEGDNREASQLLKQLLEER